MSNRGFVLIALFLVQLNLTHLLADANAQTAQSIATSDYVPYRKVAEKDSAGFYVKTDDGVVWTAPNSSSRSTLLSWFVNDPVVIYPCLSPFWSGGSFYLFNQRLETSAVVNLANKQPYKASPTSIMISEIDLPSTTITVIDPFSRTFSFHVAPSDASILSTWKRGNYVVFGSNNCLAGTFSSDPYIIINIYSGDYVRASML